MSLAHKIRTSEVKYITGDKTLYKRDNSCQWRGPGAIIGQVSQQVFIKHGSFYTGVYPCRMLLIKLALWTTDSPSSQTKEPDQTKNPTSYEIHPSATPQNVDYSRSWKGEPPRNWRQRTDMPSNSNVQHFPQQSHHRKQNHIVPSSPADSRLLSTHCKVSFNKNIKFKVNMEDSWNEANHINWAGKATGKYPNCWNIKERDGTTKSINLDRIHSWQSQWMM